MKTILVTGAKGQLGSKIQEEINEGFNPKGVSSGWHFLSHHDFDICSETSVEHAIRQYKPDIIVNCAAYTNVKKAEDNEVDAFEVNAYGVKNLAETCAEYGIFLIHISTDFVFSGFDEHKPISEENKRLPLNAYGNSKNLGEFYVKQSGCKYIIIRTSWLYSDDGHKNFVKAIIDALQVPNYTAVDVVINEVGSPTYAGDLAKFIIKITDSDYESKQGVYHYCNTGVISRYDFAKAIEEFLTEAVKLPSCKTVEPSYTYMDKVRRPAYSALDNRKVIKEFGVRIPYWKDSLKLAVRHYLKLNSENPQK